MDLNIIKTYKELPTILKRLILVANLSWILFVFFIDSGRHFKDFLEYGIAGVPLFILFISIPIWGFVFAILWVNGTKIFRELQTGLKRLILVVNLFWIIYSLSDINNQELFWGPAGIPLFILFISIPFWVIVFIILWVYDGFKKKQ